MSASFNVRTGNPMGPGRFSMRSSAPVPFPPLPSSHRRQHDLAVVTLAAGDNAHKWYSVTGPAMMRYARRVEADFITLEGYSGQPHPLINKFRVRQVLDE